MMKVYDKKEENRDLYEGLVRLSLNDKDFQRVVKWFFDTLHTMRKQNDSMTDLPGRPALSWNQGKCQIVENFLNEVAKSKETLEKYRK
jgi:hypothetical protein